MYFQEGVALSTCLDCGTGFCVNFFLSEYIFLKKKKKDCTCREEWQDCQAPGTALDKRSGVPGGVWLWVRDCRLVITLGPFLTAVEIFFSGLTFNSDE